jgi:hypothetical protein
MSISLSLCYLLLLCSTSFLSLSSLICLSVHFLFLSFFHFVLILFSPGRNRTRKLRTTSQILDHRVNLQHSGRTLDSMLRSRVRTPATVTGRVKTYVWVFRVFQVRLGEGVGPGVEVTKRFPSSPTADQNKLERLPVRSYFWFEVRLQPILTITLKI